MNIKRIVIIILILVETIVFNKTISSIHGSNKYRIAPIVKSRYELFNIHVRQLYQNCNMHNLLAYEVFRKAVIGYYNMKSMGMLSNDSILSIINYQQPSHEKRLYVINVRKGVLEYNTLVSHGMNSGNVYPVSFSNQSGSKKSSIGFYVTGMPYNGKHKYSLKLKGVDSLYNSNAFNRGIVFHGAKYVNEEYIKHNGRLGRSYGCPALPYRLNKEIINLVKGGSCLFIYYPDIEYYSCTPYLNYHNAVEFCYGNRDFLSYNKMQSLHLPVNKPSTKLEVVTTK